VEAAIKCGANEYKIGRFLFLFVLQKTLKGLNECVMSVCERERERERERGIPRCVRADICCRASQDWNVTLSFTQKGLGPRGRHTKARYVPPSPPRGRGGGDTRKKMCLLFPPDTVSDLNFF